MHTYMQLCILWGRSAIVAQHMRGDANATHCWCQLHVWLKGACSSTDLFSLSDLQRCLLRGLAVFLFCSEKPWPRCLNLEASWRCRSGKNHPARCLAWLGCPVECLKGDGLHRWCCLICFQERIRNHGNTLWGE